MSLRTRLGFSTEPLYIMDGSAFVFRGFYAFQNMTRADGFPTNVIFSIARLMLRLLREERPVYFAFFLDGRGPSFRKDIYAPYKANRSATPEPLVQQLPAIGELLRRLGLPVIVSQGVEADDCLASLARRFRDERQVVIVGSDKDLRQCLHENVVLWDPALKDEKIVTLQSFREETGMEPAAWPDYQALIGDSSDNIPGIPKIGPKTAQELFQSFSSLEEIFGRLPAVPPKIRSKLEGREQDALTYRRLTTLKTDACLDIGLEDIKTAEPDIEAAVNFMQEYELRTLARELDSMGRAGVFSRKNAFPDAAARADGPQPARAGARAKAAPAAKPDLAAKAENAEEKQAGLFEADSPTARPRSAAQPEALIQADLFSQTLAGPEFATAETLAGLPGIGDCLALIPMPSGMLAASTAWERIYTGPLDELAEFISGIKGLTLVTPDLKELLHELPSLNARGHVRCFDLKLAAYLLNPEDRSYSWQHIAERWGGPSGSKFYASSHPGLLALDLAAYFKERMAAAELAEVCETLEIPLAPVLLAMEKRGITIDHKAFAGFLDEVQKELDRLTENIYRAAGQTFNIRSASQLSDILFTVLGLPKAGKTGKGAASTSQEALEKLQGKHEIIDLLLDYRKLEKLRSTYLEPLPKLADAQNRIHTTFNQTATATGRLSSSNPNLQNIPVRGAFGGRMRACFTAAPGKALVSADYSQIELRILAHLSQDPTLLDAFAKDEDIHKRTAGLIFDVPTSEVTAEQRRNAKTINFGLIYGMGAQKLARELGISMAQAKEFMERYFSRLKKLKEFYDQVEKDAREHGFVTTMSGRRRFTPDIESANNQLRSQARRQAINTRIQGSAADIIKLAMIAVEDDAELNALEARLLLQIHDELVLEAPVRNAEAAGKRLAAIMSAISPGREALSVKLLVDWGFGANWNEAH